MLLASIKVFRYYLYTISYVHTAGKKRVNCLVIAGDRGRLMLSDGTELFSVAVCPVALRRRSSKEDSILCA